MLWINNELRLDGAKVKFDKRVTSVVLERLHGVQRRKLRTQAEVFDHDGNQCRVSDRGIEITCLSHKHEVSSSIRPI